MAEVPENARYLLFGYGPRLHALMALIANLLGIISLFLGLISIEDISEAMAILARVLTEDRCQT